MSPSVPTHDYQCPCDMCEPEAHSVQELPPTTSAEEVARLGVICGVCYGAVMQDTRGYLRDRRPCKCKPAATLPPSSRADHEAVAFEALVKKVGEGKARWSRLLALLEERAELEKK